MGCCCSSPKRDVTVLQSLEIPPDTLFALLQHELVSFDELEIRGYAACVTGVQQLLGLLPNILPALGIWDPALHAYSVLVPNFLNIPHLLFGSGADSSLVSLSVFASSVAAECAYCATHTSVFAARRGVGAEKRTLDMSSPFWLQVERATIAVAQSMATIPHTVTQEQRDRLCAAASPANVEWLVAAASMMGFLNKVNDALVTPLERGAVAAAKDFMPQDFSFGKHWQSATPESISSPVDSFGSNARLAFHGLKPGGIMAADKRLLGDAPTTPKAAMALLLKETGHDFPVLAQLTHARLIAAFTRLLLLNLNRENSVMTLPRKIVAGCLFAHLIGDAVLEQEMRAVCAHFGVPGADVDRAIEQSDNDIATTLVLELTLAISSSPAQVTEELVNRLQESDQISSAMLVEFVSLIATLQMVHRLEAFYLPS